MWGVVPRVVRQGISGEQGVLQVSSRCTQILMHYYYLNRVKNK